jgi:hypothetical protein
MYRDGGDRANRHTSVWTTRTAHADCTVFVSAAAAALANEQRQSMRIVLKF